MSRPRRHRGFAVLDRPGGSLIWNTIRPAQADAWAAYLGKNPTVEGHPPTGQIVAVDMTIEAGND